MDNQYVAQAQAAYQARDFQAASQAYVQLLQDPSVPKGPGDLGYLYHQLGNCLLQLKDFDSAIESYTQATADSAYDAVGAVNCNLGKAYVFKHDYENAVSHFEIATSDAKYDTPYKAYLGMGNALLKLGKNAEAGVAFREAALDSRNPDPSKALLNLGVCFMALNRPADAVASYESALQFDMDAATRNKMYANLGQAYVALGQMQKAMSVFESALADQDLLPERVGERRLRPGCQVHGDGHHRDACHWPAGSARTRGCVQRRQRHVGPRRSGRWRAHARRRLSGGSVRRPAVLPGRGLWLRAGR